MGQSLATAAVSGTQSNPKASEEFLAAGDIEGLLAFRRAEFGGFTMKVNDEDDTDESDEDEDEDEDDEDSDEEDEDDSDDDSDDEDEDDSGKSKKKADPRDVKIQTLSAEAKKRRLTVRDLKRKNADLESRLARLEKGKGKSKDDADEDEDDDKSTATDTRLQERLRTQTIRTEFTDLVTKSDSKYKFQDNKAAFRLLNLEDVDVDDDGDVEGLDEAIEDLVQEYPWLLVKEEKTPNRRRKTGQPTGGRKKGAPSKEALTKKYRI